MLRLLRGIGLGVVLAIAAPAAADAPSVEHVRSLLSAFEGAPSAETWTAMGPETVAVLEQLYDDEGEQPFVRLRAIETAGHYATEECHAFLRRVASRQGELDLRVRAAVRSLGKAFGAAAIEEIRPFLGHRATVVREGAALALGAIATPRARELLRTRLDRERDDAVRTTLRRALNRP
ncbi:MAG: hypothetical protein CMN30_20350 [Sandaracinus sp.]|nr:hypothetical protein [Sandaracinus sp.]|tara:strand:+ start:89 stop:622 length:534 start_codon:yes stop_codon:yes gene_type:complete